MKEYLLMRCTVCIFVFAQILSSKKCISSVEKSKINIAENKARLPKPVRYIFMERITGIEPA